MMKRKFLKKNAISYDAQNPSKDFEQAENA
jgi:hypothetical protein